MTGSVRADGTVKAVGGVPEKIEGAILAGGVETLVVPRENHQDLFSVPAEHLCRIAIVEAAEVKEILNYAFAANSNNFTNAKWEADKAISRLRIAQALILRGERKVAREILESIHADLRSKGDSSWVLTDTGEDIPTYEYVASGVANMGGTYIPMLVYLSVAKDSHKVLNLRTEP